MKRSVTGASWLEGAKVLLEHLHLSGSVDARDSSRAVVFTFALCQCSHHHHLRHLKYAANSAAAVMKLPHASA